MLHTVDHRHRTREGLSTPSTTTMSFLWGGKGGGKGSSTGGDTLGLGATAADPYANVGRVDTAKQSSAEDGVQDLVGGVAISGGKNTSGGLGGADPYGDLSGIDLGGLAPIFGQDGGPEYLEGFNKNGRDVFQRMIYNMGHAYLGGIALGGAYGAVEGLRNTPSTKFKIRLNSFLNAAGKRGSRAGNAFAVIAMMFSASEALFENFEIEKYTGRGTSDVAYPVLAGALTGFLYKSTSRRPRIMALYTIIGGGSIACIAGGTRILGEANIFL